MLVDTLKQFCQKIGVSEEQLKQAETPDSLNFSANLSAEKFNRLSVNDFSLLQRNLGVALNLNVGLESIPSIFIRIEQGRELTDFNDGLEKMRQRPATTDVRFELRIDKSSILSHLSVASDGYHSLFYFFRENSDRLLRAPLLQLDRLLFKAKLTPCLVIVSENGDRFDGNLLHIAGEDNAEDFRRTPPGINQDLREQLVRFYADDLSKPSWIGFNLNNLTPLHFIGDWTGAGKAAQEAVTTERLLELCILFTANRSSYDERKKSFQSIYASSDRTVKLDLAAHPTSLTTTRTLTDLADWMSSSKDKDRLTIFQNITARMLSSDDPAENYRLFAGILPRIYGETRRHHRVFLDGQIGKHFEEVQKLGNYVAEVAKKISESIDLVTKSVTDTLLATVAVLVITVLAALVKNEASSGIFMISLRIYAGYLVFYALYRMGSIGHSYILLKQDAEDQIATYKPKLGEDKVQELAKPIARRKTQFIGWFWVTVVLYLALAIGLWIAGYWVPQYLTERGLIADSDGPRNVNPSPPSRHWL